MEFVVAHIADLTEAQYRLFLFAQAMILKQDPQIAPPVLDTDVADAAAAVAATLETSGKGIIYQHRATSIPAQRLANELGKAVSGLAQEAGTNASRLERDAAVALRRLEQAARAAGPALPDEPAPLRSWMALSARMMASGPSDKPTPDAAREADPSPRIIIP